MTRSRLVVFGAVVVAALGGCSDASRLPLDTPPPRKVRGGSGGE